MEFSFLDQILAHRGFWSESKGLPQLEKNSIQSFQRAQKFGFGIETDIRDFNGRVVVAHDPVTGGGNLIDVKILRTFELAVALNIKADGLLDILNPSDLPSSYFFFDGSIPEMQRYKSKGFKSATRVSDLETESEISGIFWVDYFGDPSWLDRYLETINPANEYVFVSPELHGDPHYAFWNNVRPILQNNPNVKICTDYPLDLVRLLND